VTFFTINNLLLTIKILLTMKKFSMTIRMMLSMTVTAMLAVSCSNDEVHNLNIPETDAIGIEISTARTRAAVVGITELESSTTGFGVFATKNNAGAQEGYIGNKPYKYDSGNWGWNSTDPFTTWPANDSDYPMNFYAYYPVGVATLSASNMSAAVTIPGTPDKQVDMLSARRVDLAARPSSSKVTMDFKHILSRIGFKVKTGANVTVAVQSVAIKYVGETGTFDYAAQTWTVAPAAWAKSYDFMTAPIKPVNVFYGGMLGATTTGLTVTGSDGYLMLMPQDLSARAWGKSKDKLKGDESYIEVVYRIFETSSTNDVVGYTDATNYPNYSASGSAVTGALYVKVGYPLPTNWEMGKAYTYTIHLGTSNDNGGNLINDNFVDEDGNDTGLPVVTPDTNDPIKVPDAIVDLSKPIGITVDVDNWDLQPDTDLK
jgi:hypothetical protein